MCSAIPVLFLQYSSIDKIKTYTIAKNGFVILTITFITRIAAVDIVLRDHT